MGAARPPVGTLAAPEEALLDRLFSAAHVGLVILDRELRYVRLNETLAEINGLPVEAHLGHTTAELLPGLSPEVSATHRRVLETGRPILNIEVEGETPRDPGAQRAWRASYYPLAGPDGEVEGVGGLIVEITRERETRAAGEALRRLLDEEREILQRVVDRVPVGICLLWGAEHRFRLVNARFHEYLPVRGDPVGRTIDEVFPDQAHVTHELYAAVMDGETVTLKDYPVDLGDEVRYYTATSIPVPGAEGTVGGVVSVFAETTDDVAQRQALERELAAEHRTARTLERELAAEHRAAHTLERELELERRLAETLQRSLLPKRLPDIPGVELAARLRPAGERVEIGGDFYDAFESRGGAYVLVIGDVCGKGPEAAGLTAMARYTLRSAALLMEDPVEMLELLNRQLLQADEEAAFVTVACVRLVPGERRAAAQIASAGHPLPLLVRARGGIEEVGGRGMLLGFDPAPELHATRVELDSGDRLFLYTDGVTEAHAPRLLLDALDLEALLARAPADPESMVAVVERAVLGRGSRAQRDDVALLALRKR